MNRGKPKPPASQCFPLEQLQRFVQQDKRQSRPFLTKKVLPPKAIIKNHSKSLYYSSSLNRNERPNALYTINRASRNQKCPQVHYMNYHQTLNEEIFGCEKPKPQTSHYNSGRNKVQQGNQLRSNKISLRSSSNYNRLSSVAGISINEKQAQYRMQSQLNTKCNIRNSKLDQIKKQNKKMSERLESQQSQYSTKKILKAYESQQRISRRLTQSKMSKRSNSLRDNRSVYSENSSRASVKSRSSNNSQASSMKSTGRNYLPNKSSGNKRTVNRLQAKLTNVGAKNIKIQEHNINKLTEDEFSKFKKLFSNSFSTVKPGRSTNFTHQPSNLMLQKILANKNPYVDAEVLSQHSQSSQKSIKTNSRPQNYTACNSKRKLKEFSIDIPQTINQLTHQIPKKSSIITSDGLLHRIVQEMYTINQNGKTDDIDSRQNKKKKDSSSTNNSKSLHQQNKIRQFVKSSQRKPHKVEFNYSILPTNLVFGRV